MFTDSVKKKKIRCHQEIFELIIQIFLESNNHGFEIFMSEIISCGDVRRRRFTEERAKKHFIVNGFFNRDDDEDENVM